MKLVVAVIHGRDQRFAQDNLLDHGFKFTNVASTGGFLREGNVTLMIGVDEWDVDKVFDVIRGSCRSCEQSDDALLPATEPLNAAASDPAKSAGGALLFVLNVERFEKL